MATIAETQPITEPVARVGAAPSPASVAAAGTLLVATDASESADPALVAARLLNEHLDGRVEVLTVFEPFPMYLPPPQMLALPTDFDAGTVDRLGARARRQVSDVIGETADWPVDVQIGDPAATIVRLARERNASLVISGISRHGIVDRVFGEETAAHVANHVEVPLLAAARGMRALPRTVLVAIDLDSPPVPVTPVIRELLSQVSAVFFVNVKPHVSPGERSELPAWDWAYDDVLAESRERVMASLDLPPRASRQFVTLTGNPAREILGFADYAKVDLIVVGQRRRSLLQRRLGSGLPTRILRATTCSVLVLPRLHQGAEPSRSTTSAVKQARTETITDRQTWIARLAELSRRNAHRMATLEIDDTELGSQAQVSGYPFVGVDYDHHDDRVTIMLGTRRDGGTHLTHPVERPISIDVLEGTDHRLLVLRIATATGQALLSFPL